MWPLYFFSKPAGMLFFTGVLGKCDGRLWFFDGEIVVKYWWMMGGKLP